MTATQLAGTAAMSALNVMQANANSSATQASGTTGSTSSSNSNSNAPQITSTDFLTLLVSELKNQDPTQPTDPQAYVQQLVGVNSLQQLIQINQDLSGSSSSATSSTAKV